MIFYNKLLFDMLSGMLDCELLPKYNKYVIVARHNKFKLKTMYLFI